VVKERHSLTSSYGFTLAEILVTIMVSAILASIAIPTYSAYLEQARKVECQVSVVNYLRAQEMYYAERDTFYMKDNKKNYKIAWNGKRRPVRADRYLFTELGVEFKRDSFRGYRIRVIDRRQPDNFRQELRFELRTNEDFDRDGNSDYYSYRKYNYQRINRRNRSVGTNGSWWAENRFWFDIHGCQAWADCQ
jgi:prepilin-type N-terminal cleavage/methylation domain-containing protein